MKGKIVLLNSMDIKIIMMVMKVVVNYYILETEINILLTKV